MSQIVRHFQQIQRDFTPIELLRGIIVSGCALALIFAKPFITL